MSYRYQWLSQESEKTNRLELQIKNFTEQKELYTSIGTCNDDNFLIDADDPGQTSAYL